MYSQWTICRADLEGVVRFLVPLTTIPLCEIQKEHAAPTQCSHEDGGLSHYHVLYHQDYDPLVHHAGSGGF